MFLGIASHGSGLGVFTPNWHDMASFPPVLLWLC